MGLHERLVAGLVAASESTKLSDSHLAAAAAAVIEASLDRLEESDTSTWSDDEDEVRRRQKHFTDILLSKLLERGLPIPALQQRVDDPMRHGMDSLSLSKLIRNLRKLTERLGGVFQTQYSLLRILNWSQPSMTLLALMTYTLVVIHPNLLLILPLVFLLYGVMLPGYLHRHPLHRIHLHRVNARGDSLIGKFARVKDNKQLERYLDESLQEQVLEDVSNRGNVEFLVNLRDLQNNLSRGVAIFDKLEKFWYGPAGFKDERHSTSLFFTLLTLVTVLIIVGPYLPWRPLLIAGGWLILIIVHPKVKPMVKELKRLLQPQKQELEKVLKESERKDIIIDEEPELRQVEVFEIWQRSHTTNEWEFYLFSNHTFHQGSQYRRSNTPPPGVVTIGEVSVPPTWRFDDDSWNIDYDCTQWCQTRDIKMGPGMKVDKNNEFLEDEQFKRRRLYRDVIRYSRPARRPKRL